MEWYKMQEIRTPLNEGLCCKHFTIFHCDVNRLSIPLNLILSCLLFQCLNFKTGKYTVNISIIKYILNSHGKLYSALNDS